MIPQILSSKTLGLWGSLASFQLRELETPVQIRTDPFTYRENSTAWLNMEESGESQVLKILIRETGAFKNHEHGGELSEEIHSMFM